VSPPSHQQIDVEAMIWNHGRFAPVGSRAIRTKMVPHPHLSESPTILPEPGAGPLRWFPRDTAKWLSAPVLVNIPVRRTIRSMTTS